MGRIEYRELPHTDIKKVAITFGSPAMATPAAGRFAFPLIATKRLWVHQVTVYIHGQIVESSPGDTSSSAPDRAATVQLAAWARGEDLDSSSAVLSDAVELSSDGNAAPGEVITSDMGLAQQINDAEATDYANTTDEWNMDGQSGVDTPYEIDPGGGLFLILAGADIATFEGVVEVLVGETPCG